MRIPKATVCDDSRGSTLRSFSRTGTIIIIAVAFAQLSPGQDRTPISPSPSRLEQASGASRGRKLSPALIATKDSGGVLNGIDDSGKAVITVATSALNKLRLSASVLTVVAEPPPSWNPARRLKLSYREKNRPTDAELRELGLKLVEDYQKGSFLIVEPLTREIDAKLIEKLATNQKIEYATPSLSLKAIPPSNPAVAKAVPAAPVTSPNDPRVGELWGMQNIHAPAAWARAHDSKVVVAVIDSGVDYSHEDLKNNMWKDSNGKSGYDFVENDDDPMDHLGHGTHCAGTIGAVGNNGKGVAGVNWAVQIMALRWLDSDGRGEVSNAIKAIDFAVEHGAKVLNNSWYWYEYDPDLEAAIKRANNSEVLFVAAAGNFAEESGNNGGDNDQETTRGRFPSSLPVENIIAVAAIDRDDKKASFSEFGKKTVHLGAPGVNILSTVPGNDYDGTYSGTSMATPHVAGAAALAMTTTGITTATGVKKLLLDHVRKISALKGRCTTEGTLDIAFLAGP